MAKDPAVLLYTGDFLVGVSDMAFLERGYYITLLCMQHQKGHLSEETICFSLGLRSVSEIPIVMSHFRKDEDGKYYQRRMEEETIKRREYTDSRRENGKKGGRPPKKKGEKEKPYAEPYGYRMQNHMGDGNEDINKDVNSNKNRGSGGKEFESFWNAYPRKVGKEAARKSFSKIPKSEIPNLVPAIENQKQSEQWKKENGRYIPNPATWLNQGRWQDELSQGTPKLTHGSTPTLNEFEKLKQLKEMMG